MNKSSIYVGFQDASTSKEPEKKADEVTEAVEEDATLPEEEPLSAAVLDQFCERVVSGCMCLLDALPESVYRVCDLLAVVATRNGSTWRDDHLLTALVAEIAELCLTLIEAATDCPAKGSDGADEWVEKYVQREEANKLATRLHLLSLLFEVSFLGLNLTLKVLVATTDAQWEGM